MRTAFYRRASFYLPAAFAAGAFLLRMIAGLQLLANDPSVFAPPSSTDMATYRTLSEQILNGSFPAVFYYQPFYYSVFLPLIQCLTGPSGFMIVLAQSLCGAAAVWFTTLTAWMLGGKRAGVIAGLLLAFSSIAVLYTPYRLIAVSQLFWFSLLSFLTLLAMRKGGLLRWFAAGVVLSFAVLSRGNALIFLLPLLFACWIGEWKIRKAAKKRFALSVLMILLGTWLPQIPFVAVNSIHEGRLSGPSTAGSAVLALGNTPEAPPGGLEYPDSFNIWTNGTKERSVPLRILDWAMREPLAYAELTFRKCLLYWNSYDIPNNINPQFSRTRSPLLNAVPLIPSGMLLVFAFAGILTCAIVKRRHAAVVVFLFFPVLYWLATAGFYNLGRFRIPSFGWFAVAGALFIAILLRNFRAKRYKTLLLYNGSALLLAFFVVYPGYDIYRETCEAAVMRAVRPSGVRVDYPDGTQMFYDHGPVSFGGWNAVKGDSFAKRFAAQGISGNVVFSIALMKTSEYPPAFIAVNGVRQNLARLQTGRMAFVSFRLPYPADGVFHIELSGAVSAVADLQREYGRTVSAGIPLPYELLARIRTEK